MLFEILIHNPIIYISSIEIYTWINRQSSTTYSYKYSQDYLKKIDLHFNFLKTNLLEHNIDILSSKDLYNFCWICLYYFVINYPASLSEKNKNFKCFKVFILNNNLRNRIIMKVSIRKTFKQKVFTQLFYFKAYRIIYFLINK